MVSDLVAGLLLMRPGSLQSLRIFKSRAEKIMHRFLLPVVASVVLYAAVTGCANDLSRGIAFCQETYFGFARSECEQKMRQQYNLNGPAHDR